MLQWSPHSDRFTRGFISLRHNPDFLGGLVRLSCSSMEEKFPSLPQRLLNRSGSDSTRNTWSGEKLTSSLDSLPSFGTSPSSSSWADEVEDMLSSKSYASLFDSSLNSPSLPRTPPTPWTLADESCCSESDLLAISSHRGPGYHICMKEVSQLLLQKTKNCHFLLKVGKLLG